MIVFTGTFNGNELQAPPSDPLNYDSGEFVNSYKDFLKGITHYFNAQIYNYVQTYLRVMTSTSINQSNFYSANILGEARLSGATTSCPLFISLVDASKKLVVITPSETSINYLQH